MIIDEILIPIGHLAEAAASRIIVELKHQRDALPVELEELWRDWAHTNGGAVYSLEPLDQARILAHSLHILIENAERREIPYRFLSFPRFVEDPDYLYPRIKHLLPHDLDPRQFQAIVNRVHDPQSVRVERELNTEQLAAHTEMSSGELPSLETLERVAMKRELADLARRLAALEARSAAEVGAAQWLIHIRDLDGARSGFSFGDHVLPGDELAGWHFLTLLRPTNTAYSVQLAFRDTKQRIRYRMKTNGVWSQWEFVCRTV